MRMRYAERDKSREMKTSKLFLFVHFIIFITSGEGISLKDAHVAYVVKVTMQYVDKPAPLMIYPPVEMFHLSDQPPNAFDYLLPVLLRWDPLTQVPSFAGVLNCPREECNGSILRLAHWKNGEKGKRESWRLLYGVHGPVYLVSRVYRCKNGHDIIAHDESLLSLIPEERRPFILSHIAGATKDLQACIISYVIAGMKLDQIEIMINQRLYDRYMCKQNMYYADFEPFALLHETKPFPDLPEEYKGPSVNIIADCFIYDFQQKEDLYTFAMTQIPAEWISIDHTFKIAANVGVKRKSDGRWEKQYDSMFCVLNEKGCVLAWQLTKGTAFDNVKELLEGLHNRFVNNEKQVALIYNDNCCTWKKKLQDVFGENANVKLDLFHAVQRVVKHIPKRHPFSKQCAREFSMSFRNPQDKGDTRQQDTPCPETIEQQVDQFISKWKDILSPDGTPVISAAVLKEILNLKKHIKKGCISSIGPGCGTERNENMHKILRNATAKSRIGVKLAVALFTTFFWVWNEKRKSPGNKNIILVPVSSLRPKMKEPPKEKFGIGVSTQRKFHSEDQIPLPYCDKVEKEWTLDEEDVITHDLENDNINLGKETIMRVLNRALNLHSVSAEIEQRVGGKAFNKRTTHIMASHALFAFGTQSTTHGGSEEISRLINLLGSYGMGLHNVLPDGDCLFSSVLIGLVNDVANVHATKHKMRVHNIADVKIAKTGWVNGCIVKVLPLSGPRHHKGEDQNMNYKKHTELVRNT